MKERKTSELLLLQTKIIHLSYIPYITLQSIQLVSLFSNFPVEFIYDMMTPGTKDTERTTMIDLNYLNFV